MPNPDLGVIQYSDLEEYGKIISGASLVLVRKDRKQMVTENDRYTFIYEGSELKEGVEELARKNNKNTK